MHADLDNTNWTETLDQIRDYAISTNNESLALTILKLESLAPVNATARDVGVAFAGATSALLKDITAMTQRAMGTNNAVVYGVSCEEFIVMLTGLANKCERIQTADLLGEESPTHDGPEARSTEAPAQV